MARIHHYLATASSANDGNGRGQPNVPECLRLLPIAMATATQVDKKSSRSQLLEPDFTKVVERGIVVLGFAGRILGITFWNDDHHALPCAR